MEGSRFQCKPLRAGQVAKMMGVSKDILRHYERKGLLTTPRTDSGYREYTPDALDRVRLIRRALTVGFTLDELAAILRTRHQGGAPCRDVRALAERKLAAVETQLAELSRLRDDMRGLLQEWDARLRDTPDGERAWLLESLVRPT